MKNDVAISLVGVTKKYLVHHEKPTLVEKIIKGGYEEFTALDNMSLTIRKGESIGVIGPNGCGKTTLLKLISGITTQTSGVIKTSGKVVSLIDLEAGFHPDLSGLQNIHINGMILGMSRREIERQLNDIISFADIHGFIDAPLYTYSAGMKLRLGFSVAIHSNPDILLFDENMNAGDADFQKKAADRIWNVLHRKVTVMVVTQVYQYLQHNCDRILHMEHGVIRRTEKIKRERKTSR